MTAKSNAGRPKSYTEDQVSLAIRVLAERQIEPSVEAVKRHLREEQHLQINPRPEGLQIMIENVLTREADERTLRLIEALPAEAGEYIDQACDLAKRQLLLGLAESFSELEKKNALPLRELRDLLSSARVERERAEQEGQDYAQRLKASYERNDVLQARIDQLTGDLDAAEKELISLRATLAAKDEFLDLLRSNAAMNTK
jgi:hypothetical protein